ncbi:MAG: N-acetylmuramic acid 6-phosphate etherase [Synergistaceae bacterium]|jgi:N-acetylmuramic acid 6-phosphate etherase|nr:N-acetylmuramic acid 6-phosphate etherase [Synergistaceae bacterium]
MIELEGLSTEARNPRSMELDALSVSEFLRVMNDEDARAAVAVREALPQIEKALELVVASFRAGGRLIYMGAGTSGRLGVLDAAECVPTFGVPPGRVVGLIAGGERALTEAVEGAEDDFGAGTEDLRRIGLEPRDTLVGIAASGRTPYVLGGLEYARKIGASTVGLACNRGSPLSEAARVAIEAVPGPEILTGSTRLKAGTVQKMILNMLSTVAMAEMGKIYKNLMIDVLATNEKLRVRAENIVMTAAETDRETARAMLDRCGGNCKIATVALLLHCTPQAAEARLDKARGRVRKALQ